MSRHRPPKHVRERLAMRKQKDVARERMEILARQVLADPEGRFAPAWVRLMVRISRLSRIPIPNSVANRFCYECWRFWVPGRNFTVRVKSKKSVLICACGEEYPLKEKVFKA